MCLLHAEDEESFFCNIYLYCFRGFISCKRARILRILETLERMVYPLVLLLCISFLRRQSRGFWHYLVCMLFEDFIESTNGIFAAIFADSFGDYLGFFSF